MKDLDFLYAVCKAHAMMVGIPFKPNVSIKWYNSRSNFGVCEYNTDYDYYCIKINKMLAGDKIGDKLTRSVILHELIHTCEGCQNHGDLFNEYAARLNEKYAYTISQYVDLPESKTALGFEIVAECPECGEKYYFKKRSKFVKVAGAGYECVCGCKTFKIRDLEENE